MEDRTNWNLLIRHFAGETSPQEERELKAWIEADPGRRLWVEQLRRIWQASGQLHQQQSQSQEAWGTEAAWEVLEGQLSAGAEEHRTTYSTGEGKSSGKIKQRASRSNGQLAVRRGGQTAKRSETQWSWTSEAKLGVAGCLLVVCLVVGLFLGEGIPLQQGMDAPREVATGRGERTTVQLTDGSEVTLNVDSKLRLISGMDEDVREVSLEGEAYFDVASEKRPFIVHVNGAVVNVHGTTFSVKSYPEEHTVQVAVAEGSVSLRSEVASGPQAYLEGGQVGRLSSGKNEVATLQADIDSYLGWTEGRLVFNNAPLPEVANRLARWYNLTFEIETRRLRNLHLTANLKSTSIRDVLDVITTSLGIAYEIDGNRVIFKSKRNESQATETKTRSLKLRPLRRKPNPGGASGRQAHHASTTNHLPDM